MMQEQLTFEEYLKREEAREKGEYYESKCKG
jgi:hypothetical protein